uniref:Exocyst complex component 6B-like n=1 Tax=Castor canadensis TaxID=51338 RepID=A0A8B7VUC9_CASCN|nr:exocyst complex component 6B-like [Castor canadensis]
MERGKMAEAESLETAAEHERILREIESTDTACIGPTLRSVYDGEEHGRFMEKLETRIRNHDREIEKMCNFHYQGFVDSITELLKVRGEAQKLKVGLNVLVQKANKFTPATRLLVQRFVPFPAVDPKAECATLVLQKNKRIQTSESHTDLDKAWASQAPCPLWLRN